MQKQRIVYLCGHERINNMENIKSKDIIQIIISLGLGILVFYFVYKQLDLNEMRTIFHSAKWGYVIVPILLCLLSSWVRALRWNMLIEPVAQKPAMKNTFCAVMFGYFINHIFPRAGEVARCGVLKKYEKIPMSELFGTVITERAFDMLVTLLIVFFTIVAEYEVFRNILSDVHIIEKISGILSNPIIWIIILAFILGVIFFWKKILTWKIFQKGRDLGKGVWNGLKSFTKVKNKALFLFYSIFIFVIYFFMLFCSFWMFDFTERLTIETGLVTYVFGALGMIVPVQGGIGTYEFMTIQALMIYGVTATQAGTFAILAHLVEIIVNCVVGFGCSLVLPFINKKQKGNA